MQILFASMFVIVISSTRYDNPNWFQPSTKQSYLFIVCSFRETEHLFNTLGNHVASTSKMSRYFIASEPTAHTSSSEPDYISISRAYWCTVDQDIRATIIHRQVNLRACVGGVPSAVVNADRCDAIIYHGRTSNHHRNVMDTEHVVTRWVVNGIKPMHVQSHALVAHNVNIITDK